MPKKGTSTYGGLSRREMTAMIVDDQIRRGVIKPEDRDYQIKMRKRDSYNDVKWSFERIIGGKKNG